MLELNISQLLKTLDLTSDRVLEAAKRGVQKAAEELGNDSDKLAPRDQGELRRSKKITVEVKGVTVTGSVSYSAIRRTKSGWDFNYAVYLHENANWDASTPGTGPKFLERPLKAGYRRYQKIIADEIRKELG